MAGYIIDSCITNNDGTFSFSFEAESDYEYHVEAHGHIVESGNYADIPKKGRKNKDVVINVRLKGYLKIFVKNVTKKYNYFNCSSSFNEGSENGYFPGYEIDTFATGSSYGNESVNIIWSVRDSLGNYGYDSIVKKFLPAYDTSLIYLSY